MPYLIVKQDDEYCVYRQGADGKPRGETLGCHPTRDEAQEQMAALYANEPEAQKATVRKKEADGLHPASHYLVVEDPEKPSTWHLRVRDVQGNLDHRLMGAAWAALHQGYRGNRYEGPGKREAIAKLKRLYEQEDLELPSEKALSVKAVAEWELEVLGNPYFGPNDGKDVQGEFFAPDTNFHEDKFGLPPVVYYHGWDEYGRPAGQPVYIGRTVKRERRPDGVWNFGQGQ